MVFFAKNLKFLREQKGLKQADMLDKCGFKQSTWNGYERGVSMPNIDDFIKISDYFKIGESDLLHTEINDSNLKGISARYKNISFSSTSDGANAFRYKDGIVEEPASEYEQPCQECKHLRSTIEQKEETIAALHGQIAALQLAIAALTANIKNG